MSDSKLAATPRGRRTITRIVDAAAKLFGREGYQGASMTAVARAAGVSKGLLHYHFRSKDDLLIETQRAAIRRIHDQFDQRAQEGDRGVETATEALDALWDALLDMRGWAPFMVETFSLYAGKGPLKDPLDAFYEESMQLLERAIRQFFEGDDDRLVVPPERLAWIVRTSLHGLIVELAWASGPEDLARIDQTYRDMRLFFAEFVLSDEESS